MGDLLFSFVGRMRRIQYVISIICVAVALAGVFAVQQKLGDWKFAGIFITTLSVVPVIIYLAGTTRRFKDRGRHPLLGFFFYFVLPAAILFGAQQALGDTPLINPETFIADAKALMSQTQWPKQDLIRWISIGVAALFILIGQVSLFLGRGTKGPNVFDAETSKP
ncbi:DUF805 domain-containing protein [Ahrensia sp. 13_GOM-1096m]|uniref:DUF805 domain-containing protein n=1 Tax=Ahrensia sp. 13_GOM-1096m TaxID=1380380 RepID=UPI000478B84F|nr:DUF805 domain-containing protein [Ahrensia sp. 13_GOM-1096m]